MQVSKRLFPALVLASLALASTGCGFQLRGTPGFSFTSMYVSPAANAVGFSQELVRRLAANTQLEVIQDPAQLARAQVVLDILSEQREKVVVGRNAAGQVREYQLRTQVRFKLRNSRGVELIAPTEIAQQRDISFNETIVLAKEVEENQLYRDMQIDIAQQIMRRLAAIQDAR
ncbi:MAG: LPS assembly lipoprotein LptE [Burkholderiaceae bacterium]